MITMYAEASGNYYNEVFHIREYYERQEGALNGSYVVSVTIIDSFTKKFSSSKEANDYYMFACREAFTSESSLHVLIANM